MEFNRSMSFIATVHSQTANLPGHLDIWRHPSTLFNAPKRLDGWLTLSEYKQARPLHFWFGCYGSSEWGAEYVIRAYYPGEWFKDPNTNERAAFKRHKHKVDINSKHYLGLYDDAGDAGPYWHCVIPGQHFVPRVGRTQPLSLVQVKGRQVLRSSSEQGTFDGAPNMFLKTDNGTPMLFSLDIVQVNMDLWGRR